MSAPIDTRQQLQPQPLTIPADFGGLTLKQHAFVDNYIQTGNATDATVKAGYTQDRDSAAQVGSRLLRNVKVQQEIKRRLGISIAGPSEVLELLSKHARADTTDILNNNGEFDLTKAKRRRILKKIRTKKITRYSKDGEKIEEIQTEAEIHDPQTALEKLGRFHQLFPTQLKLSVDDLDSAINAAIAQHSLPGVVETTAEVRDASTGNVDGPTSGSSYISSPSQSAVVEDGEFNPS